MHRISVKSLVLSNLAHWLVFVLGAAFVVVIFYAGLTIAGGTSDVTSVFAQMNHSTAFVSAVAVVLVLAPVPAGYIAAKVAKRDPLLHGALATSVWLLFCLYEAIWGTPSGEGDVMIPHWLDLITSWGAPIPAVLGAHLWQRRARQPAANGTATEPHPDRAAQAAQPQSEEKAAPATTGKPLLSRKFSGTGLGMFAYLIIRILVPEHQRNWLYLILFVALAALIAFAFAASAFKKRRLSTQQ